MNDMTPSETLWLVLTRRCNLACGYCYQGTDHGLEIIKDRKLTAFMPDDVFDAGRRWASQWARRGLQVNLYGGEPLLALPRLRKWMPLWEETFVDAGKSLRWSITTNGTHLTDDVRTLLDKHKVGLLMSLDGPLRVHNKQRVFSNGQGSWSSIPVNEILQWRPNVEIAWQLDPGTDFEPEDLDELIGVGFKRINFNLQWLVSWPPEARVRLERFMKHVFRRCHEKKMSSNFYGKFYTALTTDQKMAVPCGTGLRMLALTPEGYLYPSQEMAFTVFEPGRAPGTAEHYRVGNVLSSPVIDPQRLAEVSKITTDQMRPPKPFDCNDCVAKSVSIGGCHCRYVGQNGIDPSYRYDVPEGYCQSMISAMTGMLQGAAIARFVRPADWPNARPRPDPAVAAKLAELERTLKELKTNNGL